MLYVYFIWIDIDNGIVISKKIVKFFEQFIRDHP